MSDAYHAICDNMCGCPVNINFPADWIFCLSFRGEEQQPRKAPFSGVSVGSSLSLNLSSWHHNQRVICQAYSPALAEGANTFYKLNVLCK